MYLSIIIFFLGISIGSFINVLISRLAGERETLNDRSACPKCKTTLGVLDLVPVLSFVLLRGQCRYCNAKLSWQYPAVELLTGVAFVGTAMLVWEKFQGVPLWLLGSYLVLFLVWTANLVVLFVYDLKYWLIPLEPVLINVVLGLGFVVSEYVRVGISLNSYLGSAVLATLAMFFLFVITKGKQMGFGDVELILMLGLVLPVGATWTVFFLAFVIGSVYGLGYMAWQRTLSLKVPVPFGPGLILAFYIVWGMHMIEVSVFRMYVENSVLLVEYLSHVLY